MKILFASHLYPNPARPLLGTFVAELAGAMAAHVPVAVVAPVTWLPGMRAAKAVPLQRREGAVEVFHPHRLACPPPLRDFRWRAYLAALRSAGLPGPCPVIHSHWIDPDAYAISRWEASRKAVLVATIHGHAALGLGIDGRPSPLIRQALHRMDHVIAVSSELQSILIERFGIKASRISVCFNGIEPQRFCLRDQEQARRRLALPLNRRLMVNVARLSPEKQHEVLFEAITKCPRQDFQLHVVGGGPLEQKLKTVVRAAGLENRVFLEGSVGRDQLPDWFVAADHFCLSSAHEGCPVVILESLACGVPIVSTRVGAVPDLVGEGEGVLCDPGNANDLAGALNQALAHSWDREAIARAGASHTWDLLARQLLSLYAQLRA